jgi:hypothetical protein
MNYAIILIAALLSPYLGPVGCFFCLHNEFVRRRAQFITHNRRLRNLHATHNTRVYNWLPTRTVTCQIKFFPRQEQTTPVWTPEAS